jgi:methyl-accepting chemotaxis protein
MKRAHASGRKPARRPVASRPVATRRPTSASAGRPRAAKGATGARRLADLEGQLAAISKTQAVIEFDLGGTILTANDNFLKTVGYSLAEVQGQHHRMFVEPAYAQSIEDRMFWDKLGRGEYDAAEYKRLARGGREVWITMYRKVAC